MKTPSSAHRRWRCACKGFESMANIHPSAQLALARVEQGVSAGPLAVAAAGAVLEAGCALAAAACVGEGAVIGAGARVGEGAVVAAGVRVGAQARIEAGAVVTRHVPPRAIVQAQAATIAGYVDTPAHWQAPPAARGSLIRHAHRTLPPSRRRPGRPPARAAQHRRCAPHPDTRHPSRPARYALPHPVPHPLARQPAPDLRPPRIRRTDYPSARRTATRRRYRADTYR